MRRWAVLLAVVGGCTPAPRGTPLSIPEMPASPPSGDGVPLAHEPDLHASLDAPSRAPYLIEALGVGEQTVSLRLTNDGARTVHLARPRVAFEATREGVSFPCNDHRQTTVNDREPTYLAPGQSFVFERNLGCSMPLPGRYEVRVYVALTDEPMDRGDLAGVFSLEALGRSVAPRPYPSRPGLYVVMTGNRATPPLPPEAWARGDYHVVVAVVNGSDRPVPVGSGRLAFSTYKVGSPLPCSGHAERLGFPEQLAPGSVSVLQAPVACAPAEEGRYEIVGRLTFGEAGTETEIGRIKLTVSRNPLLFSPEPIDTDPDQRDWAR